MSNIYNSAQDAFIERYKDFMKNPASIQEEFAKDMFELILNDVDSDCITVIPARCGISKSIFVQALISYFTRYDNYSFRQKNSIGMVIVTDMLERLGKYQGAPKNLQSIWGINSHVSHEKFCTFIQSQDSERTPMQLLHQSRSRPIVLISTQRYFSMTDEQRELLFEYQIGKGNHKKIYRREIVIFDEKPIFSSSKTINAMNFALCAAALQNGIPKDEKKKDWILQEYWQFREKMENLLKDKEKVKINRPTDRFYWQDANTKNMTTNDDLFFEIIGTYQKQICTEYGNAFEDFIAFKQLMNDGAFFITQSKRNTDQEYKTYFLLHQSSKDKFYIGQNKAKFFVFDATADCDPDYNINYVKMIDCAKYNVNINMIIHQYDVSTSRAQIVKGQNKSSIIKAIAKTIQKENIADSEMLLALTYQSIEDTLKNNNVHTAYFGGIKGSNDFTDFLKLAHVGLNRQSDFNYFLKLLVTKPNILEDLKKLNENESRKYIDSAIAMKSGLFNNPLLHEIMNKSIMADFEQNIFRTKIRDFQNTDPVHIYTYWNYNMFSDLNKMIQERYLPYGVKFEFSGVPVTIAKLRTESRKAKNGKNTDAQKILKWHSSQEKGATIKRSALLDELSINKNSFTRLMQQNTSIRGLFEKSDKQGYYLVV